MDTAAALQQLEARGKETARKTYARHGIRSPAFGVSYADLGALKKAIKVDHALALSLWKSGNHDARILATMIVDPAAFADDEALRWVDVCDNYVLTDAVAGVLGKMPSGAALARRLIDSDDEWPSAAGWGALSRLALDDRLDAELGRHLLARIEATLERAPNRTRYSMNNAIIALSGVAGLRADAVKVAKAVSPVHVDHGQTGCKTPDAAAYIAKMAAHAGAKKAKAAAKKGPAKKKTKARAKASARR